jgi:GT2 family glycosyltransferase
MILAISIVLFHNGKEVKEAVECILNSSLLVKIYLIDNSKTDELRSLAISSQIEYVFNNCNVGYGEGHNIALIKSSNEQIKYHIVMNPDISFDRFALEKIVNYMNSVPEVGSMMPKVYNRDGTLQRLCRLLPTPLDLLGRRFLRGTPWVKRQTERYELHDFNYDSFLETPCLSGCFLCIRLKVLDKTGLFDPQYFLYLEDYDLSRRINQSFKTVFYPDVSVIHSYNQGSYRDFNLLMVHMISAVKYFNKWGWFIDKERSRLNEQVLIHIKESNEKKSGLNFFN